ncbi:MAG: phosphate transporter permease, partial [Daejeonella sp.]|nr:phosphate transporter permease [Daejeonella sp.]
MVVAILFIILGFLIYNGIKVISWDFLTKMPEDGMTKGGIYPAIIGTLCLIAGSMVFAFPVGVLSAIYMNEYASDGWIKKLLNQKTSNIAGIPSMVFGLLGMAL